MLSGGFSPGAFLELFSGHGTWVGKLATDRFEVLHGESQAEAAGWERLPGDLWGHKRTL